MDDRGRLVSGTGRLGRTLQLVFLVEFGAYAVSVQAALAAGQALAPALGRVLLIWIGIRFVANSVNTVQTEWHRSPRSPEEQIGALAFLRFFLGELAAMLVVYSLLFPFGPALVPQKPRRGGGGQPIVLVPGFCCNRGYWLRFRRYLEARGHGPVYAVSLEPLLGDIEANAAALGRALEDICRETGAAKAVVIGHSMGGVTARALVHGLGRPEHVAQIICLGSPHHGTVLADNMRWLGRCLEQMSRGNAWLAALNASEREPAPMPITAISTPHDDIVSPQHSTRLAEPYATNLILPGIGHLEMVLSRPVMEAVERILSRP